MEQPRWNENEAPRGILNVSIDEISLDLPAEAKQNILRACNECSLMGYNNDKEYATLLDAKTGEVVGGHKLLEGERDTVDVSAWSGDLEKAEPLSLIAIHNHTNISPHSFGDIDWFLKNPSVGSMIVTSGSKGYALSKTSPAFVSSNDFSDAVGEYIRNMPVSDASNLNRLLEAYISASKKFGLSMKEWGE